MDKELKEAITTLVKHAKTARASRMNSDWISNLIHVAGRVEELLPKYEEVKEEEA